MSILKLAPEAVVDSNAAEDAAKLVYSDESLVEGSKYMFSVSPEHASVIVSGDKAGTTLAAWLEEKGWDVLGQDAAKYDEMPFTVRTLNPKTNEIVYSAGKKHPAFWYVCQAQKDAQLYLARKDSYTAEELEAALNNNTWKDMLQPVPIAQGDLFAMEEGTIYAIETGTEILEVEALAPTKVLDENAKEGAHDYHHTDWVADGQAEHACAGRNDIFELDLYRLNGRLDMDTDEKSFKLIVVLDGTAVIDAGEDTIHTQPGSVLFVSAETKPFHMTGNCGFALVHLV